MKTAITILIIFALLFFIGWLGLQIQPKSFSPYPENTPELRTIALPKGLPNPVERFYKTTYGDEIPVIETAVIKGRAVISPFDVELPSRFVFIYTTGRDYRHYIEADFFGLPFLKVDEGYMDGKSFFEVHMGTYYDEPNLNQGANISLWAEADWFPSLWLTDSRVRWEAVDENTARLFVPFEDQAENFVVRFNPETGLIDSMEAMRYRERGEGKSKILWILRNEPGKTIEGMHLSAVSSVTWLDEGKPWAVYTLEEVKYNVNVSDYIRARGP